LFEEFEPEHMKTEDTIIVVGMVEDLVDKELLLWCNLDFELLRSERGSIEGVEVQSRGMVLLSSDEALNGVNVSCGILRDDLVRVVPLEKELFKVRILKKDERATGKSMQP